MTRFKFWVPHPYKRLVTPLNNRRYINNFIYLSIYLSISGMAEARAVNFFFKGHDKSPLKGAWFCSRDPFCMGNCGLRKILHCTEARAVSCDKQFAADGLLLIACTALILGLRSIGSTCHRMCCKVGCITYRQQVD